MLVGGALSWVLVTVALTVDGARAARQLRQAASRECRGRGPCVPLRECPPLLNALAKPNAQVLGLISRSLCQGQDASPSVCCPRAIKFNEPPPPTPTPSPITGGEGLLPRTCGRSRGTAGDSGTVTRIFYGEEATLGAFPWMALFGYNDRNEPNWGCGGSLITAQYVVTAAHCLIPDYTGGQTLVLVRLGEHDIRTNTDCRAVNGTFGREVCAPYHQDFAPSALITHPDFNTRVPVSDDVGLVKLDRPATFNVFVQPVCLPPPGLDVGATVGVGGLVVVAGWGATETGDSVSNVLRQVLVPFVSLDDCRPHYNEQLVPEQVCFGGEGRRDSCFGDSGGPAFVQGAGDVAGFTVLGVVSRGLPQCGTPGAPAVYTSIANYVPWITSNLTP